MVRTGRGFEIYDRFIDTYGSEVKVQESSAAGERCVWIFCNSTRTASGEFTPHLNKDQAQKVVEALNKFINDNSDEEE